MGKGSGRRPQAVSDEKFYESWDAIFKKEIPEKVYKTYVRSFGQPGNSNNSVIVTITGYPDDMQCDVALTQGVALVTAYTATLKTLIETGELTARDLTDDYVSYTLPVIEAPVTLKIDRPLINEITTWALQYVTLESLGLEGVDVFEEDYKTYVRSFYRHPYPTQRGICLSGLPDYSKNRATATITGYPGDMQCDVALTQGETTLTTYTATLKTLIETGELTARDMTVDLDRKLIEEITAWALQYVTHESLGLLGGSNDE